MTEYATWIALVGAGGSLVIVLGWAGHQLKALLGVAKAVQQAMVDVPQIMPLHQEALAALKVIDSKVEAITHRLNGIDDRLTILDARAIVVKADLLHEASRLARDLAVRNGEPPPE